MIKTPETPPETVYLYLMEYSCLENSRGGAY
jgi:hypothetical protein